RFGAARLAGLRQPARLVGIERLDFLPETHALGYLLEHLALRRRRLVLGQRPAQRGACQRIGQRGMARHAGGVVVARRVGPRQPPALTAVHVPGRRFRIPPRRRRKVLRLRHREARQETRREDERSHRLNSASRTTMASAVRLIVSGVVSKLFARIANTSGSPSAVVTKPESPRTFDIEPVLARALPSAAVLFMRFLRLPSRPAIGRLSSNGPLSELC